MAFTKLVLFSTLLYIVRSANPDKGYLSINGSASTPGCYDLPSNTECPSNVINYKVVGLDYADTFTNNSLNMVKLVMMSLKFFTEVTQACEDAAREYACSNVFARCVKDDSQPLGAAVTFDVARTERACARIMKTCPLPVQMKAFYNCTMIMRNFTDLLNCDNIPDVPGDICPKSPYKHPKANVNIYPNRVSSFNKSVTTLASLIGLSSTCKRQVLGINCEMARGEICSEDSNLRMFTMTQQQCITTVKSCIPSFIPNLQPYLVQMCKLFPDDKTTKFVPLPSDVGMDDE